MEHDKTIYFMRHGRVDLPYADHMAMPYEILDDLATGKRDPGIAPDSRELFVETLKQIPINEIGEICYNNSGRQSHRSFESAQLVAELMREQSGRAVPVVGTPLCKEVDFNLPALLSKAEFKKGGMPAIRTALYHAEITGSTGIESMQEMFARIERLFALLKEHGGSVIVISHDFFMRVLEVYLAITKNPNAVKVSDLERTALNIYATGFKTSANADYYKRF